LIGQDVRIITKPKEIINLRNDPWSKTIIVQTQM
jgi:hypothetical protein